MTIESPTAFAFDPEVGALPEGLAPASPGEVIALLAEADARVDGWSAQAAASLARGWANRGREVFLLDCNPGEPSLHRTLGVENREGVTDAVLYGVSPSRIALDAPGGFLFAPAGTAVADPAGTLRHPRWKSVLGACRASDALVLLYLPAGESGVEHLLSETDRSIRLTVSLPSGGAGTSGAVALHPVQTAPSAPAPGAPLASPSDPGEGVSSPAPAEAVPAKAAPAAPEVERPTPRPAGIEPRPVKRRTSPWILLLLLVIVGGVLAAVWLGLIPIPGLSPTPDAALAPFGSS